MGYSGWKDHGPRPVVEVNDHQNAHQNVAPTLPEYGLTSIQVVCAREMSKGRKASDVRKQYMILPAMWNQWVKDPQFIKAIQIRLHRMDQIVEDNLRDGEVQASATLIAALAAETPTKYKDGKIRMLPNWEVRTRAAISLLDRRGERGKPVERVQSASFNVNSTEVRNELAQALADPGVLAFLESDPALAQKVRAELRQLSGMPELPPTTGASDGPL